MYSTYMLRTSVVNNQKGKATLEKFFEPCVLYLLLQGPSYGYELKRNLETKCHCPVDTGNLYRALRKFEPAGWVTSTIDRQAALKMRRIYSITEHGKHHLAELIKELEEQRKIITKLVSHYDKAIRIK